MKEKQSVFIEAAKKHFGDKKTFTRKEISEVVTKAKIKYPRWLTTEEHKVARGTFSILSVVQPDEHNSRKCPVETAVSPVMDHKIEKVISIESFKQDISTGYIPRKCETYEKHGHAALIEKIIKSKQFVPVYISGHSGNGKTLMVEQSCANTKRNLFRVNITKHSDEDSLIGGFRLIDGNMKWFDGPVTLAAETGSVLLLDEVDFGSENMLCLMPVLEGNPFLIKQTNRIVVPKEGFTVFATANTKGKGSDDGRYVHTNVLNEAFLERFPITMEQEYPNASIEKKILKNQFDSYTETEEKFVNNLCQWAELSRKLYDTGAIDEIISTRRLVHIATTHKIVNDEMLAISLCIARFDSEIRQALIELYDKINPDSTGEKKDLVSGPVPDPDISF